MKTVEKYMKTDTLETDNEIKTNIEESKTVEESLNVEMSDEVKTMDSEKVMISVEEVSKSVRPEVSRVKSVKEISIFEVP